MDEVFDKENGKIEQSVNIEKQSINSTNTPLHNLLNDEKDQFAYAGFWIRFWAFLVDVIMVWGLKQIFVMPFTYLFDWSTEDFLSPYTFLSAVVFYLYFVLLTKYFGQTLGKMIFGLKVIPLTEEKFSWKTVLFREWIGRYISTSFMFLYFLVAFLPKKQGLHDFFSDTAVIHENYRVR
ncbi:RDD family protein [Fervidibacillus halotolerans]|uniref:RDD family protein n=1 Tax=Fervidibacillus halotolerans TaxID=2980027 RepID=A0A9E8RXZ7_9BACI|nr:RDD family protein [Fervidibacillus halotolerans]WAA11688.1 RDD family protein [Fervidibacillus halotolerans]